MAEENENLVQINDIRCTLLDNKIYHVKCRYSGGGDSGDIDSLEYIIEKNEESEETDENFHINYPEVHDFLTTLFMEKTNNIEDWWNNDGGYGTIILNCDTLEYKIENNIYYNNVETYHHEDKLDF